MLKGKGRSKVIVKGAECGKRREQQIEASPRGGELGFVRGRGISRKEIQKSERTGKVDSAPMSFLVGCISE